MNITIVSGSPRKESVTVRVAKHLRERLSANYNVTLIDLKETELPFVQKVWTKKEDVPAPFEFLWKAFMESDSFIFVSPEYNGVYSPALKNIIDHFPKSAYARKVIGIATASDGAFGGIRSALHLQQQIAALFGVLCPYMLIVPAVDKKFGQDGKLEDASFQPSVNKFVEEYTWLATAVHQKK